jgi:hypothetical protein
VDDVDEEVEVNNWVEVKSLPDVPFKNGWDTSSSESDASIDDADSDVETEMEKIVAPVAAFTKLPCKDAEESGAFKHVDEFHSLPIGHTWEWFDNYDDHFTTCCKMTLKEIHHGGAVDGRPDVFTGAELVHEDPVYALILYERTPVLRFFEFNDKHRYVPTTPFSTKTWLRVSLEMSCQLLVPSNVTHQMDPDTIFTRITQAAKNIAKVNSNATFSNTGNLVHGDTIVFANNIVKKYFYERRNLVRGLDFMK